MKSIQLPPLTEQDTLLVIKIIDRLHEFTDQKLKLLEKLLNVEFSPVELKLIKLSVTRLSINCIYSHDNLIKEWHKQPQLRYLATVLSTIQLNFDRSPAIPRIDESKSQL